MISTPSIWVTKRRDRTIMFLSKSYNVEYDSKFYGKGEMYIYSTIQIDTFETKVDSKTVIIENVFRKKWKRIS